MWETFGHSLSDTCHVLSTLLNPELFKEKVYDWYYDRPSTIIAWMIDSFDVTHIVRYTLHSYFKPLGLLYFHKIVPIMHFSSNFSVYYFQSFFVVYDIGFAFF